MSTPNWSRVGDLILRHAVDATATTVALEPKGQSYVVTTTTQGQVEQIMAPPPYLSLGLFVHFCRRAQISKERGSGDFTFEHQGRSHQIEMHIVSRPEGKGALLLLS